MPYHRGTYYDEDDFDAQDAIEEDRQERQAARLRRRAELEGDGPDDDEEPDSIVTQEGEDDSES